jgi:hypothetical protein
MFIRLFLAAAAIMLGLWLAPYGVYVVVTTVQGDGGLFGTAIVVGIGLLILYRIINHFDPPATGSDVSRPPYGR